MIYNLRKKFIIISAVAVSVVFALIFGMIYIASTSQLNHTMDMLTNVISKNDGVFPDFNESGVLLTYNARRKFYSDASKTFNTILPLMLREFMKLSLNTLTLIKQTYYVDFFESAEDRVKYLKEIHNWYKTYADILKTTSVS